MLTFQTRLLNQIKPFKINEQLDAVRYVARFYSGINLKTINVT